jgi:two-component system cell cycle response regulator/two-component system cell cycle response regulator DivK
MKTILLVEDDLGNRVVTEDIFQFDDIGAQLVCAGSAEEGMRLAAQIRPILILMDIRLPGVDGLSATRQLKGNPGTKDIPIWAITAYAMTEDREKAVSAGCEGYITKPVDATELAERLREFVRRCGGSAGAPPGLFPG